MIESIPQGIELRNKITSKLLGFGYYQDINGHLKPPKSLNKNSIRIFHNDRRQHILHSNKEWINEKEDKVIQFFANGEEIDINSITPKLIQIQKTQLHRDIFRYATYLWSIPVSQGYGRRLRYLVMDSSNNKIIGIFGLTDPVIGLKTRDDWIGWSKEQKVNRLWHVLDAYVLGAVPPYNMLLGGKLVASLVTSDEVRKDFQKKYENKKAIISGKKRKGNLVLVTTNTALGKSSMLSRLYYSAEGYNEKNDAKYRRKIWEHIGWTSGYGHFHLDSGLADEMIDYLHEVNDPIAQKYNFGEGPQWKMRVIKKCLQHIGLNENNLLYHGIKRGLYCAPLARNFKEYLCGKTNELDYYNQTSEDISLYIRDRYLIPRGHRILDKWKNFSNESIRLSKEINE